MQRSLPHFTYRFDNKQELLAALDALIKTSREYRRHLDRSHHKALYQDIYETYNFSLLYATLAYHDKISYPFYFEKSESPDFLVLDGEQHVGLEITRATEDRFQAWLTQIEDKYKPFEKDWAVGSQPETETSLWILERIIAKNRRINIYSKKYPEIDRFKLLIVAEHPSPLHEEVLAQLIYKQYKQSEVENDFEQISIIVGKTVIHNMQSKRGRELLEMPIY